MSVADRMDVSFLPLPWRTGREAKQDPGGRRRWRDVVSGSDRAYRWGNDDADRHPTGKRHRLLQRRMLGALRRVLTQRALGGRPGHAAPWGWERRTESLHGRRLGVGLLDGYGSGPRDVHRELLGFLEYLELGRGFGD